MRSPNTSSVLRPVGQRGPRRGSCRYCGKTSYYSRKAARTEARRLYPGEHMSAYECLPGEWHVGHLPRSVIQGQTQRADLASGAVMAVV